MYMKSFPYLCIFDTMSPWRVETKRHVMEETPEWLEHDVDELEEEVSEDVSLPGETDLEQEGDIESFPQPVRQCRERLPTRERGGRHPTSSSTLYPRVCNVLILGHYNITTFQSVMPTQVAK
jgi:hypothetical protein